MVEKAFPTTENELLPILKELIPLEPIFHTPEFGTTLPEFDQRMLPDYWEVGASGKRYTREFILDHLARRPPVDAVASGWQCSEHGLLHLGEDTYLLTYRLRQGDRLTMRSTIWRKAKDGWRILYHQGTIAAPESE